MSVCFWGVYTLGVYSLGPPDLDLGDHLPGGLHSGGLHSGGLQNKVTHLSANGLEKSFFRSFARRFEGTIDFDTIFTTVL